MKRNLVLWALLCAMLLSTASCGGNTENISETTADTAVTETETETETELTTGLEPRDLNGYTFRMVTYEQFWNNMQLDVTEETGEVLNDSIYRRNRTVEEECNILFEELIKPDPAGAIRQAVTGGTNDFDVAFASAGAMMNTAQAGHLLELYTEVPNLDLSRPWWTQTANDYFSIAGKLYVAAGEISLSYFDSVMPLAMNLQMVEDFGLKNPYELVRSGNWTMDEMGQMLTTVSADVNGDEKYTLEDDRFGMFGMSEEYAALCIGSGYNIIQKDENDIPYLAIANEGFINAFSEAIRVLNQPNVFANYRLPQFPVAGGDLSTFTSGRALFFSDVLYWIYGLRDMEDNFAILPRGKYDVTQKEYYSYVHESSALMGIPVTVDADQCGYVLETLSCESHKTVIPEYYNTVLSAKYARDTDSIEMLDIVFTNRISDLGCIYNWGNVYSTLKTMGEKGNTDIASTAAKMEQSVASAIEKVVKAYTEE